MKRVLFVDDDELFLKSQRRSLLHQKNDWDMLFMTDVDRALNVLKSGPDTVLVVDWMMPSMDGLVFAEKARKVANGGGKNPLHIIMLTARKEVEDEVRALESEVDDYLSKPIDTRELAARISVGFRLIESERNRINLALRETEYRYRQALENSPHPFFAVDEDGRIQNWNKAAEHTYKYGQEIIGKHYGILLADPKDEADIEDAIKMVFENQSLSDLEIHFRTAEGTKRICASRLYPIHRSEKEIDGCIFANTDITEQKQAEDLRSRFVEEIISAQDEERRQIARELHDEIGQWIGSIIAGLTGLEDVVGDPETKTLVRDLRHLSSMALGEVRRVSKGLHPALLESVGLAVAVRRSSAEFSKAHGISVKVEILGLDSENRLPIALETTLYRIVQETLTNIGRHARAKTASVYIVRQPSNLRLVVEDDGSGFNPSLITGYSEEQQGLGLVGIRERVALFNGSVSIESVPDEGTTVAVQIPLEQAST